MIGAPVPGVVNVHQVTILGGWPLVPSVKVLGNTKKKVTHEADRNNIETFFFFFCRPTVNSLVALSTWCKWRETPAHLDSTSPKSYSKYKRWSS